MVIDKVERTPSYIMLKLNRKDQLCYKNASEAEKWCQQTGCGKRVNQWSFAFKSKSELTMFTLKWL